MEIIELFFESVFTFLFEAFMWVFGAFLRWMAMQALFEAIGRGWNSLWGYQPRRPQSNSELLDELAARSREQAARAKSHP